MSYGFGKMTKLQRGNLEFKMAKKTKSRDSRAGNKMNLYEVYYFSGRQRHSAGLFRAKNLVTLKKRLKKEYSGYANIDEFLYKRMKIM